jgi:hypothetical protein
MVNRYTVRFRLIGRKYHRHEFDTIGVTGTTPYSAKEKAVQAFKTLGINTSINRISLVPDDDSTTCPGMATPVK